MFTRGYGRSCAFASGTHSKEDRLDLLASLRTPPTSHYHYQHPATTQIINPTFSTKNYAKMSIFLAKSLNSWKLGALPPHLLSFRRLGAAPPHPRLGLSLCRILSAPLEKPIKLCFHPKIWVGYATECDATLLVVRLFRCVFIEQHFFHLFCYEAI